MDPKIYCASLLAFVLPLSACVAAPTDEESDDVPTKEAVSALSGGPWTWVNDATGRCLDSNGAGSGYTLSCNGGAYQNWTNVPSAFGDKIIDQATGRCLDSNGAGSAYTLPCNGGRYQEWTVTFKGASGWEMRNVATGRCLDSNGAGSLYTLACNNGNYQRWH